MYDDGGRIWPSECKCLIVIGLMLVDEFKLVWFVLLGFS